MITLRPLTTFVATLLLAGCGGGSGGGGNEEIIITPPPTLQSPGSHWFVLDVDSNPAHFFISETGKIRATFHIPTVSSGPSFGAGMVNVTGTNVVGGNMLVRGIIPLPGSPLPDDLSCDISGTVVERQVLNVQLDCSAASGVVFSRSYRMTPQPGYDEGSSLEAIAGNYTIAVRPDTNILNIISDGSLFGMFHNGANCTINGLVSEIDTNYRLLDVEWTMSLCTDSIGIFEGAEMSGFAIRTTNPNISPDSYYFILTGKNGNAMLSISITYEPV